MVAASELGLPSLEAAAEQSCSDCSGAAREAGLTNRQQRHHPVPMILRLAQVAAHAHKAEHLSCIYGRCFCLTSSACSAGDVPRAPWKAGGPLRAAHKLLSSRGRVPLREHLVALCQGLPGQLVGLRQACSGCLNGSGALLLRHLGCPLQQRPQLLRMQSSQANTPSLASGGAKQSGTATAARRQ